MDVVLVSLDTMIHVLLEEGSNLDHDYNRGMTAAEYRGWRQERMATDTIAQEYR